MHLTSNMLGVGCVALGLAGIVEGARIAWYIARGHRTVKKFEQLNPSAEKKILMVGDSTGCGSGASAPCYSIAGRIGADFPHAHLENLSKGGLSLVKAGRVICGIANTENQPAYDLVIIMIGGMNIVYVTPLWLVRRALRGMISCAKRCGREVIIISPNNAGLAPLYRFPIARLYRQRSRAFHALYKEVTQKEQVRHVSLFREKNDEPLVARDLFHLDKTHPNDEGYGVWYDEMRGAIRAALTS